MKEIDSFTKIKAASFSCLLEFKKRKISLRVKIATLLHLFCCNDFCPRIHLSLHLWFIFRCQRIFEASKILGRRSIFVFIVFEDLQRYEDFFLLINFPKKSCNLWPKIFEALKILWHLKMNPQLP